MSLAKLLGNENIKRWLKRAGSSGRMPGALIFAGPGGVGKQTFALELAKALNCQALAEDFDCCDKCRACQRIAAHQFADVRVIAPDGQFIKIDQVRAVVDEIHYRPFEGRTRVYIFTEAERLREQAANALLKTLEEPPANALLVLVTASPDALLPTIRSRAMLLRFAPLTRETLQAYLAKNYPRPAAELELLARLAMGSIGRALSIDLSQFYEQRKECLELLDLLLRRRQRARLLKAAEYFGKKEREEFEARLELTLLLLRDINCARLTLDDEIINLDLEPRLRELSVSTSFQQLSQLVDRLTELQRELVRNLNRQLALEAIFLDLCQPAA